MIFKTLVFRHKIKVLSAPQSSVSSVQEKQAALEAVLASETFARSEQLRAFLRFVCEMEANDRAAELTEYLIGVKALGRPEDFSPLDDSSVRTRAYDLRQRLQKFYTIEKPDAAIQIELPKGSYAPRFVSGPPALPDEPQAPARSRNRLALGFLGGLLAGIVVTALAAVILSRIQSSPIDPAIKRAWAPLIGQDAEILICIGSPLHLEVTPYMGPTADDQPTYPAPKELYDLFSRYRDLSKDAVLEMQPTQKAVPLGNVESVASVVSVLQALHARSRILAETASPLIALERRSAVLIGSPWYSRSASVLLERTPWTFRWDDATRQVGLLNQRARGGRKLFPQRGPHREYEQVFGLVSVLPNGVSPDTDRTVIVFSGLTSAGTYGAAAYFTSGAALEDLEARFHKEGLTAWPKSFQVVVRCRTSSDAQLLSYAYENHEILIK